MEMIPYPLFNNFYCQGYEKHLQERLRGKTLKFNFWFFCFNIFWLIRHRMYLDTFLFLATIELLMLIFTQIIPQMAVFGLILGSTLYFAYSFKVYDRYHKNCLHKIDYNNNNPLHKIKPLFFLIPTIIAMPISMLFLNISTHIFIFFKGL